MGNEEFSKSVSFDPFSLSNSIFSWGDKKEESVGKVIGASCVFPDCCFPRMLSMEKLEEAHLLIDVSSVLK